MRIGFVCAEEGYWVLPLLVSLQTYAEVLLFTPPESNFRIYEECGIPTAVINFQESPDHELSSFDAVLYLLSTYSYQKLKGFIRVPGILLLKGEVPFTQFNSYKDAILHFFFEEDPINEALLIMSETAPHTKTLCPFKEINFSSGYKDLTREIFSGIRLAHAFLPFYNFMVDLRDKFLKDMGKTLLTEEFIEELVKELNTFYDIYKLSIESFS